MYLRILIILLILSIITLIIIQPSNLKRIKSWANKVSSDKRLFILFLIVMLSLLALLSPGIRKNIENLRKRL
jgi:hypothetical protein